MLHFQGEAFFTFLPLKQDHRIFYFSFKRAIEFFTFRFSLFVFHFSLFTFHFSLFKRLCQILHNAVIRFRGEEAYTLF